MNLCHQACANLLQHHLLFHEAVVDRPDADHFTGLRIMAPHYWSTFLCHRKDEASLDPSTLLSMRSSCRHWSWLYDCLDTDVFKEWPSSQTTLQCHLRSGTFLGCQALASRPMVLVIPEAEKLFPYKQLGQQQKPQHRRRCHAQIRGQEPTIPILGHRPKSISNSGEWRQCIGGTHVAYSYCQSIFRASGPSCDTASQREQCTSLTSRYPKDQSWGGEQHKRSSYKS